MFLKSGFAKNICIVDLPESLIFSYAFLRLNFPNLKISFARTLEDLADGDKDILLVPSYAKEILNGQSFDLAVNTGSMQEMPFSVAADVMHMFEEKLHCSYFYSLNYALNDHHKHKEVEQFDRSQDNLVCPKIDTRWRCRYFKLNPSDIKVDTARNWMEILLERTSEVVTDDLNFNAKYLTQEWFGTIWMALWKTPTQKLVDSFVCGLADLVAGKESTVCDFIVTKEVKDDLERIGEVAYWSRLKETLPK